MHTNNRRRLSTLTRLMAAAVLALVAGAWTGPRQHPAENGVTSTTITFGQTAPQSGPAALYGQSRWGVLAEFAAVNAHGGVQGRKLQLISLDDQYQPPVAVQATRKLVDQYKVFAEVAVNGSATTKADLTVLEPANVPLIGPQTGATYLVEKLRKNVYNVWPSYLTEGKLLGSFAKNNLHLRKIGVFYQNDDFGKSLYDGVKSAGVRAAKDIPYDPSQTDFSAQAEQLKARGIDGVIILAIPGKATALLNAMANIDYKPARIMSQTSAIPQSFSSSPHEFPGSYIGAFIPPLTGQHLTPQAKAFLADMARYEPGKPASVFAAWGYMEAQVAVAGLKAIHGAITRESYEAALNSLKNVQTLGGTISYSPTNHNGVQHMFIVKAEHGQLVAVTR
jgi:ABC-type branched-subunit amino acid transport system substrate-binding protein